MSIPNCPFASKSNNCSYAYQNRTAISNGCTLNSTQQISLEKIWKRLYESRDFELNSLLSRSSYIWTILALSLCGYGYYILSGQDSYFNIFTTNGKLIGLSLSFLIELSGWLLFLMGRASKYWYEVYEEKIIFIEDNCLANTIPQVLRYNFLNNQKKRLSPSRINNLVGLIVMIIGIILFLCHLCYLLWAISPNDIFTFLNRCLSQKLLVFIAILLFSAVLNFIIYLYVGNRKKEK